MDKGMGEARTQSATVYQIGRKCNKVALLHETVRGMRTPVGGVAGRARGHRGQDHITLHIRAADFGEPA